MTEDTVNRLRLRVSKLHEEHQTASTMRGLMNRAMDVNDANNELLDVSQLSSEHAAKRCRWRYEHDLLTLAAESIRLFEESNAIGATVS